jgi:hypothetical protein
VCGPPLLDDLQRRFPHRLFVVNIIKLYGSDYGGPTPGCRIGFVSRDDECIIRSS